MGWKDLLQKTNEFVISPWIGGRVLRAKERAWNIEGNFPQELGWCKWQIQGRVARFREEAELDPTKLDWRVRGYLVGDRILVDQSGGESKIDPDPKKIIAQTETVFFIEPGLDRFVRVVAGRVWEDGPLFFENLDMPLGSETEVNNAFMDRIASIDQIPNVTPGLDAAFRMESWQRLEAERRRAEQERIRREEEEKLLREEQRRQFAEKLGTGQGRREMATVNFEEAAVAALRVGGAQFLDNRPGPNRQEVIVRFRVERQRFECVCHARTLQIIDSGICLTDHDTGERHDTKFTLESLPGVIREAMATGQLVVFRHVN